MKYRNPKITNITHHTSRTFPIPNMVYQQHATSQKGHISNIKYLQHPTYPKSRISKIPRTQHLTSATFNITYVYVYECFIWIWRDIALYRYIVDILNIHHPNISHISNVLHLQHLTSPTRIILNSPPSQHPTSKMSHIPNMVRLKRSIFQTFHILNILHLQHSTP